MPATVASATRHDWLSVGVAYQGGSLFGSCGIEPMTNARKPEVSRL